MTNDSCADDGPCASGETKHTVAPGDTMTRIAQRYYCRDGDKSVQSIAQWLEDHNGAAIGEDRKRIYPGTLLCLPAHFRGAAWEATRCWPEIPDKPVEHRPANSVVVQDKPSPTAPPQTGTNPSSTPQTVCTLPDETRSDGHRAPDKPTKTHVVKPKTVRLVEAELNSGAFVPLSDSTRNDFYQALGFVGIGARFTLGRVNFAPRLMFVASNSSTRYNGLDEQPQNLVGPGASAQFGLVLRREPWSFITGIEGGWMGVRRSITRSNYPSERTEVTSRVGMLLAGVFVRSEYTWRPKSHLRLALEFGGDVVSFYRTSGAVDAGFNVRLAGGASYAF